MAYRITPASMSAPSELSAKATSTRLTRTLALAAVPALALAPPVPSRRVNRSQIQAKKAHAKRGLFFLIKYPMVGRNRLLPSALAQKKGTEIRFPLKDWRRPTFPQTSAVSSAM